MTTKTRTGDESDAAKLTTTKRRAPSAKGPRAAKPQRPNEELEEESRPARASGEGEGDGELETNDDGDDAVVGELASDLGDDDGSVADVRLEAPKEPGLRRYDAFTAYLSEVQRHKLLTPDEEHELAVRYATTQDVKAAARMVTANLRLVVKIAFEYRRAYRNLMDLIQEGNIGLMQAVKRYDPYRGVKLSSYAAWWIRAYILRFILNNWRLVKLGTTQTQRKLFFNLNKEKQRLISLGVDPTSAELSRQLDVPEHEVIEMDRRLSGSDLSLDAPIGDGDGKPTTRMDLLPSTMPATENGQLRPLAVSTRARSDRAPSLPTLAEAGVAGYEFLSWQGFFAPKQTPDAVVQTIAASINAALAVPELRRRIVDLGAEPMGGSPADMDAYIASEVRKLGAVAKAAKIEPE